MRLRVHSHHPRTPTLLSTSRPHHGGASPTVFARAATTPPLLLPLLTEVTRSSAKPANFEENLIEEKLYQVIW